MVALTPAIAVIALGNEWRGDDAAGLELLQLLRRDPPERVALSAVQGDATHLLAALEQRAAVVLVDAVVTGAAPGTVHCWRWRDGHPALAELRLSTHKTSLIDALALAEALGRGRPELIVVGIEAAQFTLGAALSPAVASALDEAVVRVYGELRRLEEGLTTACTSSR